MVADVMFPIAPITRAVAAFQEKTIAWRLYIEGQRAVVQQVLERRCPVGIMASLSLAPPLLTSERLLTVRMTLVVSPQHPLAIHGAETDGVHQSRAAFRGRVRRLQWYPDANGCLTGFPSRTKRSRWRIIGIRCLLHFKKSKTTLRRCIVWRKRA
jgi:DNA-binding transcriptional LysR family regulator